jgi:LPXTG-site transpeptidase (sortase) family protein
MLTRGTSRTVRLSVVSFLLATPTVLLVSGSLLLGFGLTESQTKYVNEDPISVTDPAFAREDQYVETNVIKRAPMSWEEHESALGTPILVSIRALELHSSVIPVTAYSGVMEIPEDISQIGWFVGSVSPGHDQGSAVLVGHRDGSEGGRGAFYDIDSLDRGDFIFVTTSEGIRLKYTVIEVELLDKDSLPLVADFVFAQDGDPRLTLITCGGDYETENGGYQANVIVTAVPV